MNSPITAYWRPCGDDPMVRLKVRRAWVGLIGSSAALVIATIAGIALAGGVGPSPSPPASTFVGLFVFAGVAVLGFMHAHRELGSLTPPNDQPTPVAFTLTDTEVTFAPHRRRAVEVWPLPETTMSVSWGTLTFACQGRTSRRFQLWSLTGDPAELLQSIVQQTGPGRVKGWPSQLA